MFAVVIDVIEKLLMLDKHSRIDISGEVIAIGHALRNCKVKSSHHTVSWGNRLQYGVAAVCNGGEGAAAIPVQRSNQMAAWNDTCISTSRITGRN